MPVLMYPLALLGLVAVPGLVAIYMMHHRFRRKTVSSLFLWDHLARSRQGGRTMRRMPPPWIFLLELLVLLCLLLAAVDPRWHMRLRGKPLHVVLDNSVSMLACNDTGESAWERAHHQLLEEISRANPAGVQLILAGSRPTAIGALMPPDAVPARLQQWSCHEPQADLQAGIAHALELGGPDSRVLVVTDLPPATEPKGRTRWLAMGQPAPNAGIVNAARSAGADGHDRCLLEIANPGPTRLRTSLVLDTGTGEGGGARELALAAGERRRLVVEVPSASRTVTASLQADALAEDNMVWLLPPRRRPVRVAMHVADETLARLLERTVAASGLQAGDDGPPQLWITDRQEDAEAPAGCWVLRVLRPAKPIAYVGPFVVDLSHPLGDSLSLESTVWAGQGGPASCPGLPVVCAGDIPLVWERSRLGGAREVTLWVDPGSSTLCQSPDWPILFWNLLRWRSAFLAGFAEPQLRLGGTARFRMPRQVRDVRVDGPHGMRLERRLQPAGPLLFEPRRPGLYHARAGATADWLACNLMAPAETDLSACASGTWGQWDTRQSRQRELASSTWLFGLLALGLLTLHGAWQHRQSRHR